jgi:uncharacterized protein YycO
MIRLRFVRHKGIFSWLTSLAQYNDFPYSHVEAIRGDTCISSWFLNGGVRVEPADYDKGTFQIEKFMDVPATPDQEKSFFVFLSNQVGKPYDWRAIVSFYTHRGWQEEAAWECAELIAAALVECGIFPEKEAIRYAKITLRDLSLIAGMVR